MIEIPLSGKKGEGFYALVDDEDEVLVLRYKWHRAGGRSGLFYARTNQYIKGSGAKNTKNWSISMHTLITGLSFVDHVNGNGLDNQRHNLREATWHLNAANRKVRSDSQSGYKGVTWSKQRNLWAARLRPFGETRHLGFYATPEEAARAYDEAAYELWGEWARLNYGNDRRVVDSEKWREGGG